MITMADRMVAQEVEQEELQIRQVLEFLDKDTLAVLEIQQTLTLEVEVEDLVQLVEQDQEISLETVEMEQYHTHLG